MKRTKRQLSSFIAMILFASTMTIPSAQTALAASDTQGHWAESTINKWTSSGYISGYPDGTFRPNNAISRAEFVTLANKAFGYNTQASISFSDVQPQYWAYAEIQKGVAAGYIKGDSIGTFRPGAAVTRQEAAVMMAQIKKLQTDANASTGYTDYNAIANWAKPYVGAVSNAKVMQGFPNGAFRPQTSMTRAEAVTALENAIFAPVNNNTNNSTNNNNTTNNNSTNNNTNINNSTNNNNNNTTNNNTANYTLEDTSLRGRTINGDLIISSSLNSKDVTLNNVIVKGTVKVQGGGTIKAQNCDFNKVELDKSNVVFRAESKTKVRDLEFLNKAKIEGTGYENVVVKDDDVSEATIDAEVNYVELDTDANLKLYKNADISTLEVTSDAKNGEVTFTSGSEVDNMTIRGKIRIYGKGDINDMTVYVSGIRSSIKPDKLTTRGDGEKPSYTSGSSGSSSSSGSQYDDLTIDREDKNFDADGEKYHNVSIEADGVEFSDAIVYNRLTITRDVEDGEVILDDVTVRGDVYVYGGGKNSVIFRDCDIQGDIISDKDTDSRYGDEPVALEFEDDTEIDGDITVRGNTIIRAESDIKLNDVTVQRTLDEDLIIDARMQTLEVNSDCDVRITSKARIDNVNVGSSRNVVFRMEGSSYIGTLDSSSDVVLRGNGTVKTIRTDKNVTKDSGIVNDDQTSTFVAVTGISGIPTTGVTGQSLTLSPVVSPNTASYKTVKWTITSNGAGANISGDRVLTATKDGTVTLLATIDNGKASGTAYTQSFTITFSSNVTPPPTTASKVTDITNANASNQYSVAKGGSIVLTANVDNKVLNDNEKVVWTVADADKEYVDIEVDATYSQIVTIRALKADTSDRDIVVTAKVDNGDTGKTRNITILKQGTTPTPTESELKDIDFNPFRSNLQYVEGESITLTAQGASQNSLKADDNITWTTNNTNGDITLTPDSQDKRKAVIVINNSNSEGNKTATVTATLNGKSVTKTITILPKNFTLTTSRSTLTLPESGSSDTTPTATLTASASIANADGYTVEWEIDNNASAELTNSSTTLTVNNTGAQPVATATATLTPKTEGTVKVTATLKKGNKVVATKEQSITISQATTPPQESTAILEGITVGGVPLGGNTADSPAIPIYYYGQSIPFTAQIQEGTSLNGRSITWTCCDSADHSKYLGNGVETITLNTSNTVGGVGFPTGKHTIKATTPNGSTAQTTIQINIFREQKITEIQLENGGKKFTAQDGGIITLTKPSGSDVTYFLKAMNGTSEVNDNSITWTLEETQNGVNIPSTNGLVIPANLPEGVTTVKLKATIPDGLLNASGNQLTDATATVTINIQDKANITGIRVENNGSEITPASGGNVTVQRGQSYNLTVQGEHLDGRTIYWKKEGANNTTGISLASDTGTTNVLTVSTSATNDSINVIAWVDYNNLTQSSIDDITSNAETSAKLRFTVDTSRSINEQSEQPSENEQQIAPQASTTQKAAARRAIVQQPAQNVIQQTAQKPYIKDITLPIQQCEAGKDFDLSQAKVETVGENNFVVNWYLMRGFAEIPDSHTVRMDRAGTVTMQAYVEGGAQDGTAYTKDFVITFTEPQQPSEQQKLLEEQQKQQEQQKLLEEQQKQQEQQKLLEEQQKQQEQQKLLEEQQKQQEQQKLLEEQQKQQEQQKLLEEQQKQQEQQHTQFTPVTPIQPEQPVTTPVTPVVPAVTTPVTTVTPAVPVTTPAQPEDTSIIISYMGSVVTNSDIILYAKKADGTDFQNAVWSIANDGGTLSTIEKNVLRATNKGNVIVKVTISNGTGLPKIRTKLITIV